MLTALYASAISKRTQNLRHSVLLSCILRLASCVLCFFLCSLPLSAEILDVQVLWDVEDEPLNIGDVIHFKVTTDGPGSVIVDISTVHQSIQLYDDGTNGDAILGDRVHELEYAIFEGDTVEDGPILVHFVADDGTEVSTSAADDITPRITIDGTRPIITNDSVSPDPFNPHLQFANIRYILTEKSSVSITIFGDQNQLIRRLGTPSGQPGENQTTWNGADNEGNIMPDGVYTYEIVARDRAGNYAISTRGGCILSTVYIELDDSLIAPNPFSPDGDDVSDVTWMSFDIKLVATQEQLAVLGFGAENFITASTEDDGVMSPFALLGISIFNSSGESQTVFSHDLTPEGHIEMLVATQRHIDSAVSKTVNAPNSHTVEDTGKVYQHAWRAGAKSVAYYRDQSRSIQVQHTELPVDEDLEKQIPDTPREAPCDEGLCGVEIE